MPFSNTVTTRPGADAAGFAVPSLALFDRGGVSALADDELLAVQADLAELRRQTDANLALAADEIARRSHFSLGHSGLAQRLGSRTAQQLVQHLTGASAREAAALVRVGSMLPGAGGSGGGEADAADAAGRGAAPWLQSVGVAVADARLGVDASDAIARGLGEPDSSVSSEQLDNTARQLVAEASLLTVEQLAVRARDARALLDLENEPAKVEERERALRERRSLQLTRQADGMTRLTALLDPESAALVRDAVDAATSPRRGGPRFVSAAERERAERMLRDGRTTTQLAVDALVELVRLGGAVAPVDLIGVRAPAVQVIVAERDLRDGRGLASLEGQSEPVSMATAERHACTSGVVPIVIDGGGEVIALGRASRLFTRRQRVALAARDGGCRFPGCERPPSWTEAHHVIPWSEGGATDLDNAVLLCRHHHLLLHNNGWALRQIDGDLHVIPPPDVDADQVPVPAPRKSRALERALTG